MVRRKRSRVPNREWGRYKNIVRDFIEVDAGYQPFLWLKKIHAPNLYGEDQPPVYEPIVLRGLFHYNYIRTWPINRNFASGEQEGENQVLYITKSYLDEHGYLTDDGYWDFDWSADRFISNGKVYKPDGDTEAAQAKDEALVFFVILNREDPEESARLIKTYNQYLKPNGNNNNG